MTEYEQPTIELISTRDPRFKEAVRFPDKFFYHKPDGYIRVSAELPVRPVGWCNTPEYFEQFPFFSRIVPLKKKAWKPEVGGKYYYVYLNPNGLMHSWTTWHDHPIDYQRYDNGNVFQSREDAQKVIDAMETIAQVRERVGV